MANLFEIYLAHIEARLVLRMPKDVADEHVKEIRAHLTESIAEQVRSGLPEEQATVAAIRRLGNDSLVAEGLIHAHSGIGDLSVWRLIWLPTVLLFAFWALPLARLDSAGPEFAVWEVSVCLCFVAAFVYACWKSRRFLAGPTAIALGLVLVGATLHDGLGADSIISVERQNREQMASQDRIQIAKLQQWTSEAIAAKSALTSSHPPKTYMAPAAFQESAQSGSSTPVGRLALTSVNSKDQATRLWRLNGDRYMGILDWGLRQSRIRLRSMQSSPWVLPQLAAAEMPVAEGTAGIWLGIALLNLLVLGVRQLRKKASADYWNPLRLA